MQSPAAAPPTVLGAVAPGGPASHRSRLPWVVAALMTAAALALAVLVVVVDRRADSAGDDVDATADRLIGLALPGEITVADCTPEAAADGELRRLSCPDGSASSALPAGVYAVLDGDAGESVAAVVDREGLDELEDVYECGSEDTPEGYVVVDDNDGVVRGSVACYVDESDNDAVLVWAWDDLGTRGEVRVANGGVDDVDALAGWWDSSADRGF